MEVVYLVACILGVVTTLMIVKVREQLKMAQPELGMLAMVNAILAIVLFIVVAFDLLCLLRTGAGLIKACRMAFAYIVVAAVEWKVNWEYAYCCHLDLNNDEGKEYFG